MAKKGRERQFLSSLHQTYIHPGGKEVSYSLSWVFLSQGEFLMGCKDVVCYERAFQNPEITGEAWGKSTKIPVGRSSKYWRRSQGQFGQTEKQNCPQFFPEILSYISLQSVLHCLFIASATFLLIKFFPHEHCGNM